ncbi:MAG TPA: transketolase C-terminal domain-containing protein [Gemmatimonadaceae bacterium]
MIAAFIDALAEACAANASMLVINGDCGPAEIERLRASAPSQYINGGIAEANLVGVAAGLAAAGLRPVVYSIAAFLTGRAFEQIRVDIGLQNLDVKLVGIGAGVSLAGMGATHYAIDDIALMRMVNGMTILLPADSNDARGALTAMLGHRGPTYLRLTSGNIKSTLKPESFVIGQPRRVRAGSDLVIVTGGSMLHDSIAAADVLARQGVEAAIVGLRNLGDANNVEIANAVGNHRRVLTVEDHRVETGIGSAVAAALLSRGHRFAIRQLGIASDPAGVHGPVDAVKRHFGIDTASIVAAAHALLTICDGSPYTQRPEVLHG